MNDQQVINVMKGLIIDGVSKARSGHPGGAMSSIDFAYWLYKEFLCFDPDDPLWPARDRFVLSAGHESMMLYTILRFVGWLDDEDLKNFRQWGSRTPGHPEVHVTPGVECTTGPLGQGAAMSVGMAMGAKHVAAVTGAHIFSNRIYALLGDGCMQEDVTLGAASYAGHLGLDNLVWYYDKNKIQISGSINRVSSDDEKKIFEGFGWQVFQIKGSDHQAIRDVLQKVRTATRPTLIIGDSIMAHGAFSMEGRAKAHGAPFSDDERRATKEKLGLPQDQDFYLPEEALRVFRQYFDTKKARVTQWQKDYDTFMSSANERARHYVSLLFNDDDLSRRRAQIKSLTYLNWKSGSSVATRQAFGELIESWCEALPQLVGGSADLEPSNMTEGFAHKVGDFQKEHYKGRNFAWGVREFPMSCMSNGLALFGRFLVFDATFLSFSDYSRAALRLGALQKINVIHELTHDSFYLGEDGPTHQPVEHLMSLRLIPNFWVMRPADAYETQSCLRVALNQDKTPVALCLSRQKLPILDLDMGQIDEGVKKGAYLVHGDGSCHDGIIFATGSEVSLAIEVARLALDHGQKWRVVSVPCWEIFWDQDLSYQDEILAWSIKKRVSCEAGATTGWQKFTGIDGLNIGLDHFGASAPAEVLAEHYGFTANQVWQKIEHHFKDD